MIIIDQNLSGMKMVRLMLLIYVLRQHKILNNDKVCIDYYDKNKILSKYTFGELSNYIQNLAYILNKTSKRKKLKM